MTIIKTAPPLNADDLHLVGYTVFNGKRKPVFVRMPSVVELADIRNRHGEIVTRVLTKGELQGAMTRYEDARKSSMPPDVWAATPGPYNEGLCVATPICKWFGNDSFTLVDQAGAAKALLLATEYGQAVVICLRETPSHRQ
jgi:hypothetical protein